MRDSSDAFLAKDFAQGNHVVVHLEEGLQSEAVEPLSQEGVHRGFWAYTESSSSASSVSSGTHPSRAMIRPTLTSTGNPCNSRSKMHDTVFTRIPQGSADIPRHVRRQSVQKLE